MSLLLTKYYYDNVFTLLRQEVRVYSKQQGANGRVVLEDIISVLLTSITLVKESNNQLKPQDADNVLAVTKEKIEIANINAEIHEDLHLADIVQLHDFYSFCDDLSNLEAYQTFGDWLSFSICPFVLNHLAHLGNAVGLLPFWEEYPQKVAKLFGKKEKLTIGEWLNKGYRLTVPWIMTLVIFKVKSLMLSTFSLNPGEQPQKNKFNANVYSLETFALIAQRVERLLSGSNNWSWLKELLNSEIVKKAVDEDWKLVKLLCKDGKSDEQIIQTIWNVTPTSNLVETNNYQYEILKVFIQVVQGCNVLSESEAIDILESNNMKPSIRQLGSQKNLLIKLINGYSFIVGPDQSKPGYFYAFLNSQGSGALIIWKEIDHKSLTLVIIHVQALLKTESKWKLFSERQITFLTFVLLALLLSMGYLVGKTVVAYCDNHRLELPLLFKPN